MRKKPCNEGEMIMSTSICSPSRYPVVPLNTETEMDKFYKEDLAKTVGFIKARKYTLTNTALLNSKDLPFSLIHSVLKTAKHESIHDEYNDQSKRWSFSFCGTTDEGDNVRLIVSPDSYHVRIINVKFLKNDSLDKTQMQEQYKLHYNQILDFIEQDKITLTDHAKSKMREHDLTTPMIRDVLLHGAHFDVKDNWNRENNRWAFSFRDQIHTRDIVVCVSADKTSAVVITVYQFHKFSFLPEAREADFTSRPSITPFKEVVTTSFKPEELDSSFDDLLRSKTADKRESISSYSAKRTKKRKSIPPPSAELCTQASRVNKKVAIKLHRGI